MVLMLMCAQVSLTGSVKTVIVQRTRNAVGMVVCTEYRELCKYNLQMCATPEELKEGGGKAKGAQPAPASAAKADTTEAAAAGDKADKSAEGDKAEAA
jgi:hypothetical protein